MILDASAHAPMVAVKHGREAVPLDKSDPAYWRDRADEARAIAYGFRDPEARQLMLEVANNYEKMAVRAQLLVSKRT